jgi:hypothetical protein
MSQAGAYSGASLRRTLPRWSRRCLQAKRTDRALIVLALLLVSIVSVLLVTRLPGGGGFAPIRVVRAEVSADHTRLVPIRTAAERSICAAVN